MNAYIRVTPWLRRAPVLVLGLALAGCSKDDGLVEPPPEEAPALDQLPNWGDYSPLEESQPPTQSGEPEVLPEVTMDVETVNDSGQVVVQEDVTFACTVTPYTMKDNPDKLVMYEPDRDVLWAGGLIQGKSHRDGVGSLLSLPITERAPIRVSIPDLPSGENFRQVDNPSAATVNAAIGEMRGDATLSGLATPSSINFDLKTYHAESEFALSFNISARYLAFEGSATGDLSRNESETSVSVNFVQRMFTVVVDQPQTPNDFFSDEFTQAKYDQQVALGRIGPDNIPVYVAQIVYGRMMMFSMTSTSSAKEIEGTIRAAYEGIGSEGSAALSTKQQAILREAKIAITSLGGDAQATLDMIRSGNWADYFTNDAPLSSAQPLSYTLKSLTGEVAKVTEATEYEVKECTAQIASPGAFSLTDAFQQYAAPFSGAGTRSVLMGDVNGDGRADLVWNERISAENTNRVFVGFGQADGSFDIRNAVLHSESPDEGWETYDLLLADVDGDGRSDLVWNHREQDNVAYIGMSQGDGTFAWRGRQVHTNHGWGNFDVTAADVDGDGRTDIVWNSTSSGNNRVYVGYAQDDTMLTMIDNHQDFKPGSNWSNYQPVFTGDVNRDGRADLIWNALTSTDNCSYTGRYNPADGTFTLLGPYCRGAPGWLPYATAVGDIDGFNGTDIVWTKVEERAEGPTGWVHRSLGTGTGGLTAQSAQSLGLETADPRELYLYDVNADAKADLIWNHRSEAVNRVHVGFGTDDGKFTFPAKEQVHPALPPGGWSAYRVLLGDINSDGKADVVWNIPSSDMRIYVGLAK